MKSQVVKALVSATKLPAKEIENLIEVPPSSELGDYAFPCFILSKKMKMSPDKIALDLVLKIKSKNFEKVEAKGPYINFFLDRNKTVSSTISEILKKKDKYGSSNIGKGKNIVIDLSSPNIAKPFGIGHLRSTIIGSSIAEIGKFLALRILA